LRLLALILFVLSVSACSTHHLVKPIDMQTGKFSSYEQISEADIKIYKPIDHFDKVPFILLRAYAYHEPEKHYKFMVDSLKLLGVENVMSDADLTKLIIKNNLSAQVNSLKNPIALNNLSKIVGPFLILEFVTIPKYGSVWEQALIVSNPFSVESVLRMERTKTYMMHYDNEFNYPVLDLLNSWVKESKELSKTKPKDQRNELGA